MINATKWFVLAMLVAAGCLPALAGVTVSATDAETNVFSEGNFETLTAGGTLKGWDVPHPSWLEKVGGRIEVMSEDGTNHFVRVSSTDAKQIVRIGKDLPVQPEWKKLKCSIRIRASNLKLGEPTWAAAKSHFINVDEKGEKLKGTQWYAAGVVADTDGWVEKTVVIEVSPEAKAVRVWPGLYCATGTMDFDDIRIVPLE
ncbi:MAG: hypothetical protein NZ483_05945 [Verrucomicrobiae bacterium]|nr:hypothetical protein [Verrucomicrobiae bacterium]MDW8343740.1 hypothetical protein [Verrucomicrobiae bacterium]